VADAQLEFESLQFVNRVVVCTIGIVGNTQETITPVHTSFAVLLSRPFRRLGSNPIRSCKKELNDMGRRQTETSYQSEAAYLKSVLLWLQDYWTGPALRYYLFAPVEQGSKRLDKLCSRSARKTLL
jgi:hypothetical protein